MPSSRRWAPASARILNVNKLRYHKVIIMADADVDGSHIRTCCSPSFFRFMRPLIEGGYVYAAMPPLFRLERGKTVRYAYDEKERDRISAEMRGPDGKGKVDITATRASARWTFRSCGTPTMNPEQRILKRITMGGRREGGRDIHHSHGRKGGAPPGVY